MYEYRTIMRLFFITAFFTLLNFLFSYFSFFFFLPISTTISISIEVSRVYTNLMTKKLEINSSLQNEN